MYKVIKRDGTIVEFNIAKIKKAIARAFEASAYNYNPSLIEMIAIRTTADFNSKIKDDLISVEDIQDSVEKTLSEVGYSEIAKKYILYRKQREKARNISSTMIDYRHLIDSYIHHELNDNDYSIESLILLNSASITANYWLSDIYDEEISFAHQNGDFYIHDLGMLAAYKAKWDLPKICQGNNLNEALQELLSFIANTSFEWSADFYFPSFDTYLASLYTEEKEYSEIKKELNSFLLNLKNIIFFKDKKLYFGFDFLQKKKTNDLKINIINQAVLEIISEKQDFNYFNLIYMVESDYLREDAVLIFKNLSNNIYFCKEDNFATMIGEVSINLVRLAYSAKDKNDFYQHLDHLIKLSLRCLDQKKETLNKLLKNGLYPFSKLYLNNYDKCISEISLVGLDEMFINASWLIEDLNDNAKNDFIAELALYINNKLKTRKDIILSINNSKECLSLFAKKDKEIYQDIIFEKNSEGIIYHNNWLLKSDDLFAYLDEEDKLDNLFYKNYVVEIKLKEFSDWQIVMMLAEKINKNYSFNCYRFIGDE